MWTARAEPLDDGRGFRYGLELDSRPATFLEVLQAWQVDASFRSQFNDLLAESSFLAFRWETPGITEETTSRPFEFVLLESPELARTPDPDAFSEHFEDNPGAGVVVFPNLGKNAVMIAPCPIGKTSAYGHLAAFVRRAPGPQRQALWKAAGDAMMDRIGRKPVWLSTAGAGVSWLHVRLDDRPKYYGHAPYREAPRDV